MANDMCIRRLTKELRSLAKDPILEPKIIVAPNEKNMLEIHYLIDVGEAKGNPYENGVYHGKLIFPKEYPLKPPGVMMMTPSGRFQPNRRLCLSMSDFHPESWNPMWSVSTILTGLYSFMIESNPTLGSIETTAKKKRQYAADSLAFNCRDKMFCKLFPEYVERYEQEKVEKQAAATTSSSPHTTHPVALPGRGDEYFPLAGTLAGLVAILSIVVVFFRFL